jgi:hypothetical protein
MRPSCLSTLPPPAPHRFSLLREHASEGTIFVQEICDAEGRRWSLRVPASGLPEDMVSMLEELEKLALELGQALPRIVVTCSAESLSSKRAAMTRSRRRIGGTASSSPSDDVNAIGGGYSLAKEKCRLVEPEASEIQRNPSPPSSIMVSSPSEQSLTCIYLPEVSAMPHPRSFPASPLSDALSCSPKSWRPSSCPEARPLQSWSPQTVSTANRPAPDNDERSYLATACLFRRAQRQQEPARSPRSGIARRLAAAQLQPASRPKPKPKPKCNCNRIHPFFPRRRPDPASR